MRSGRGEKQHPESPRRPSMRIVELPAPSMQPPHRFRKAARSAISGSRAAPRRMVLPLAQAAASRSVSVAPTLGKRRVISAPCRPEELSAPAAPPQLPAPPPPFLPAPPDAGRWAGPRCGSRRAGWSRRGPALPAGARRTKWRPAFVPLFAPAKCCWQAGRRVPHHCPPTGRHSPRPAKAPCNVPRPQGGAQPGAAPLPCRAAMPQKAAERCFLQLEFLRFRSAGGPLSPRSVPPCPCPHSAKDTPPYAKQGRSVRRTSLFGNF